MTFDGQVVLVTGASRGIGAAIARAFAAEGASVVVNYLRDDAAAAEVVAQCKSAGGDAWAVKADVTDPAAVQSLVGRTLDEMGRIDVVVNNAFRAYAFDARERRSFDALDWSDYEAQFAGSVGATYHVCKAVLPHLRQRLQGSIVNIVTDLVEQPSIPYHDYTTAKAALVGFSRNLAAELGPFGIRVNCVAPGLVFPTEASRSTREELREAIVAATPLRRLATPGDIAGPVLFLASPWSRFMTGQVLMVDGGLVTDDGDDSQGVPMMATATIGIAGAGLLGRLLAFRLSRAGHRVSVFDPAADALPAFDGRQAAGFTAAGMLSPLAELDNSSAHIAALGWRSLDLWRDIVASLRPAPDFRTDGSLLLAHRSDLGAARRVLARLAEAASGTPQPEPLTPARLAALEPALHGAAHAWLLPGEGQIDAVAAMRALAAGAVGVSWHWRRPVRAVEPGRLVFDDGTVLRFDRVFDVRGVGARPALPVRGVRGEMVWLHAPGHGLQRPVRLLHPRHRVYVVPRPGDQVMVGASEIESEDRSPATLRSAVELMSAAHSIMPALAEARILRLDVNLRPALPDNEPHLEVGAACVRINGLFRHGWLIAPALVEDALQACGLDAPASSGPAADPHPGGHSPGPPPPP